MPDIEFEISGLDSLMERLGSGAMERIRPAIARELNVIAEEVMSESLEIVPVDTGTLMSTGHVDAPQETEEGVSITLGYGGPAASYALAVHENLDPNVHWKRPGSGPKYLEIPLKAKQDSIPRRLSEAAYKAL
jgi:hypothetical protein